MLIRDSHAMHWRPSLQVVAEANGWRGISVARAGCPFSVSIPRSSALGPAACGRLHRRTIAWLRAHPSVDTVFISNWAAPRYGGGPAGFGAMLDRLPASVRHVYVLRDIPRTTVRAVSCVRARRRRHRPLVGACAGPRSALLAPDAAAVAAASRPPRMRVVDLSEFFCGRRLCFPVIGGAYVHKDLDHMNAVFSTSLGPFVLRALRATWGPRS